MLCMPGLCVADKGTPRRRLEFQHRAAPMLHRVPDADNLLVGRDFDASAIAVTVGGVAPVGERITSHGDPSSSSFALRPAAVRPLGHVKLSYGTAPGAPLILAHAPVP